ncbi:phosphoribosyl-AMP cyclohydrolase [Mariprofundus sp. KV]|uniref:phosphoribosyl-AMP cyclohydrolase n=1 Tax=Mariprofundus sp. KV TaxID=2608715 RepID=UPI00159F7974|nr:phosphoribosyl-AMP cyclohydrolase [Mariprofundus sp. KV]NWF37375.1 phosphoribosyl-AMP cyclohydrolase [Mariprofundus sp. KV]
MSLLESITFNEAGLVPAIAQDAATGRVLMMAWMNEEALEQTQETGFAHYYSRSRRKQWMKGESSGHVQKVIDMYLDCDGDTMLLIIEQTGPACHTNRKSCFYKKRQDDQWVNTEEPLK